jgi:hypothetical protein
MKFLIVYIATDGWKRKFAEHGTPILNVMILLPLGGSIFHKVVASGGECKNTQWVVDLHMNAKAEVEALYPNVKVAGFVMDNTKANTAAMNQMGAADPSLVNVGCVAHGLALLFKDLGKKNPQWIVKVYKKALDISNVVNGAQRLNQLLHDLQREANIKKPKGLSHHCPTRFAVMHAIAHDIQDVKAQLSQIPLHDKYTVAVSNVEAAREKSFKNSVTNGEFWVDLKKVLELMKPVAKAISHLEGDKPLLSTVYTIMMDLMKHAKDWEAQVGEDGKTLVNSAAKYKGTAAAFEQRITSHMKPSIMAAWLLDPRNMEKVGEVYHLPNMNPAHKAAALKYITERGTGPDALSAIKTEVTTFKIVGIEDSECVDYIDLIKSRMVEEKDVSDLCLKFWSSEMGGKKVYPMISKAAVTLLGMHATACATERNWSIWGNIFCEK